MVRRNFSRQKLHEQAVYGLPEFFRDKIKGKKLVANPGCYTTCSPLAIAPAIVNGLVSTKGIICDCKSGVTGAGRKPNQGTTIPNLTKDSTLIRLQATATLPKLNRLFQSFRAKRLLLPLFRTFSP